MKHAYATPRRRRRVYGTRQGRQRLVAGANSSTIEQAQALAGDRCHGREGFAVDFGGNNFVGILGQCRLETMTPGKAQLGADMDDRYASRYCSLKVAVIRSRSSVEGERYARGRRGLAE